MPPASEPELRQIADGIFVVWKDEAVLEFSHVTNSHQSLSAEVHITSPTHGAVLWGRITLASTQSRRSAARAAEEVVPSARWIPILDRSCQLVATHLRTGEPVVPLVARPPSKARWLVDDLLPAAETSVIFGDGGAGKSLLALALALAGLTEIPLAGLQRARVAPLRHVLLLDWETCQEEHEARWWALAAGLGITAPTEISYCAMRRPLSEDFGAVRRHLAERPVDLVICDSLGPAAGPEPEGADAALRTLAVLRTFSPATRLVVAHMSKASADAKGAARPFGSVYVQNLARSVIEVRRDDADDSGDMALTLYHRKINRGRRAPPLGLRFEFDEALGTATVYPAEADLSRSSLSAQILAELRGGAQTVAALSAAINASASSVKSALHRLENRSRVVALNRSTGGRGSETQWGRVDKTVADEPF